MLIKQDCSCSASFASSRLNRVRTRMWHPSSLLQSQGFLSSATGGLEPGDEFAFSSFLGCLGGAEQQSQRTICQTDLLTLSQTNTLLAKTFSNFLFISYKDSGDIITQFFKVCKIKISPLIKYYILITEDLANTER